MTVSDRFEPLIAGLQGLAMGLLIAGGLSLWSDALAVASILVGFVIVILTYGIERKVRKISD